jgi:DNA (cytosine-5)-methyltransferase 1
MAGFEFDWVGFSEIDPYAIKVYEKHYPDAHNLGDITKIDGEKYKGQIDLITGGFPCQDISVAGKGEGITGARSGLWKEMFRLICEIRPRYVIVENVPALLGRGLDVVLGDIASIWYDAEWGIISASDVGSFHKRERIWILAYPQGKRLEQVKIFFKSIAKRYIEKPQEWKQFLAIDCRINNLDEQWKNYQTDICGNDDGLPKIMDRLRCLGNSVVPQVVAWIGQRLKEVMDNE